MNTKKINELKKWMQSNHIDYTYISDPGHIAYFSGFNSQPHERVLALFVSLSADSFLFTPALEVEDAQNSSWTAPVYGYLDNEDPWSIIANYLRKNAEPKKIALEKEALTVARFDQLAHHFPNCDFSQNVSPIIERLQLIKTTDEITKLMQAGNWADIALEIGFNAIGSGVKEQEIIAEIEYQLKRKGASQMSFDTLVLAGKNASSPHGHPGQTKIVNKDLILFDLGVIHEGYCSDVSRTVSYGQPTDFHKEIYAIVLEAQLTALDAVKPGITAGELDELARSVIHRYGYAEYFNHRLGHGIGTTVHEYPSLVTGNDLVIEEGMCFSIEPGIYIPGEVGVRIEDCLHVTSTGCEPFTKTTKELICIEK